MTFAHKQDPRLLRYEHYYAGHPPRIMVEALLGMESEIFETIALRQKP